MGINTTSSRENQIRRLQIKTLDQQMKRVAVDGTGISPWEAEVLIETINEVYFRILPFYGHCNFLIINKKT